MSIISYDGDPTHTYKRIKEGSHYKCCCTTVERRPDGIHKCNFCRREDHLKDSIKAGKIHTCQFEKLPTTNTMERYFMPRNEVSETGVTVENIITKLAILTGRRNLSLATGASQEMTDALNMELKITLHNLMLCIKVLQPIQLGNI